MGGISGEEMYQWCEELCRFSPRIPGTKNMDMARDYIVSKLQEFGLEAWAEPINFRDVFYKNWQLKVLSPEEKERTIVSYPQVQVGLGDVEAELVDVGRGKEKDYEGKDIRGRIVFVNWGSLMDHEGPCALGRRYTQLVTYDIAWEHGASGMIGYMTDTPGNSLRILEPGINPTGGSNTTGPCEIGPNREIMLPVLFIGRKDAEYIKNLLKKGSIRARMLIEGKRKVSTVWNVMGRLQGKTDGVVLVASHYDGTFTGTLTTVGAAGTLGIAKYFSQKPLGEMEKTMVFLFEGTHEWINCNIPALIFVKNHPDMIPRIAACIWLDFITSPDNTRLAITSMNLRELTMKAMQGNGRTPLTPPSGMSMCTMGVLNRRGVPTVGILSPRAGEYLHTTEDTMDKISPDELEKDVKVFIEIAEGVQKIPVGAIEPQERARFGCGVLFSDVSMPEYPAGECYVPEDSDSLYVGGYGDVVISDRK